METYGGKRGKHALSNNEWKILKHGMAYLNEFKIFISDQ